MLVSNLLLTKYTLEGTRSLLIALETHQTAMDMGSVSYRENVQYYMRNSP